ncbi:MAG: BlaI/MecI/CopY family transcriptional regulator [Planctomycetaceae bacterium]|nr:BlaI/MecI/CopY family transcriptional regulator [Planctomycetaceae bacterium]
MPRESGLPPLTHRQLEIMDIVWQRGETTVGEVWTELSRARNIARNTVQTMITRLDEKGWLRHRAEGKTFYYRATQPSDDDRERMARCLLDSVFEGSVEGLLRAILHGRPLSRDEVERLHKLIDQASAPR